jgi:RNA polymerase sigma-70 factor (ECF subfamily)
MAYRLVGNDADAKDLAQEAFLRVFRALRSVDPAAHLDSWLYRIVTNLFIDMLRRRPKVRIESLSMPLTTPGGGEVAREIADERANPEADVVDRQMDADVQAALLALHPDLRAIVIFSDIEGFAYEEIADMLRIPVGTVKSRLHRARKMLQAKLAHLGFLAEDAP